jgi:hypothetical protein
MKKLRLLLLDANIVIYLFSQHLWDRFVESCEVYLSKTVIDESEFFENDGEMIPISLESYIESSKVEVFELTVSGLKEFMSKFDPVYLDKLDPGEAESLAYLYMSQEEFKICSADGIVFRVIGVLDLAERGISLEEVLKFVGLERKVPYQYTKEFRIRKTSEGTKDRIQGMGITRQS